jgi:hypothetical protein
MEVLCGRHNIVGRLDAVIRWNGLLWHLQHKTIPPNKVLPVYIEQQRTDWHEAVYQRMMEEAFPDDDIGGTVLNCIKKLSMKAATERPHAAFELFYLPRSEEEVDDAFLDLAAEIDSIEQEQYGLHIVKNRSFCGGAFGNSLCQYKEVCDGVISINDDTRFISTEARYPTEDV